MGLDRMKGKRWFTPYQYQQNKVKLHWTMKEELYPEIYPPGSHKSITTPGQAISLKDLMDRYEKGRPQPVE